MNSSKLVVWNPQLFKEHYETSISNNSILSALEKRKFDFLVKELKLKTTDVILDVGCGYGRFSKLIRDDVGQIVGIDINPENISYAKEYVGSKFQGMVVDLSAGVLPFENKSVDKIVIDNVLMFFNKDIQSELLKEIRRILKENGVVAFNTENSSYILGLLSYIFSSLYRTKAKLQGKISPVHNKFPLDFYERKLNELGFTHIVSIGDTFYRKMGIGGIEIFPGFLHPYIKKLDQKYFNTVRKEGMASFTIAASL